jgi:thiol-disulfide isomerase/thioredoxin
MNKDNISALLTGVGVVALIVGFAIYFISPQLNKSPLGNSNDQIIASTPTSKNGISNVKLSIDKSHFKKAPEFTQITDYINTKPIKLSDLKGKVVLVHFWTYTCINCIHTIPHLNDWYAKYANKGFVIVGVQTPEFEFEKNIDSVKEAVKDFKIKYPVIQDNDYGTWNAYGNRYWPRDYLLDNEGYIRYDHIGEGGYKDTENIIQSLLAEPGTIINVNSTGIRAN